MILYARFQVGPKPNYFEWLKINIDVKLLQPSIATRAAKNPSHCFSNPHGRAELSDRLPLARSSEETETNALWSFPPLPLLSCNFNLSSSTLYIMLTLWSPAPNIPHRGALPELKAKRPLSHVPYTFSGESCNLDLSLQYQYPLSFIFGKMWALPPYHLTRKRSLTRKSIYDSSVLKFSHVSGQATLSFLPVLFCFF